MNIKDFLFNHNYSAVGMLGLSATLQTYFAFGFIYAVWVMSLCMIVDVVIGGNHRDKQDRIDKAIRAAAERMNNNGINKP